MTVLAGLTSDLTARSVALSAKGPARVVSGNRQ